MDDAGEVLTEGSYFAGATVAATAVTTADFAVAVGRAAGAGLGAVSSIGTLAVGLASVAVLTVTYGADVVTAAGSLVLALARVAGLSAGTSSATSSTGVAATALAGALRCTALALGRAVAGAGTVLRAV